MSQFTQPSQSTLRLVNRLRQRPEEREQMKAALADPLQPAFDKLSPWRMKPVRPEPVVVPEQRSGLADLKAAGARIPSDIGRGVLSGTELGASSLTSFVAAGMRTAGRLLGAPNNPITDPAAFLENAADDQQRRARQVAPAEPDEQAGPIERFVQPISRGTGEMVPLLTLGAALAGPTGGASLGPAAAAAAGASPMFVSGFGRAYQNSRGQPENTRLLQGVLTGAVDQIAGSLQIDKLLTPAGSIGAKRGIAQAVQAFIQREGGNAAFNGTVNGVQTIAQRAIDRYIGGDEAAFDNLWREVGDSAAAGAAVTPIIRGGLGAVGMLGRSNPTDAPAPVADSATRTVSPGSAQRAGAQAVNPAGNAGLASRPNAAQSKSSDVGYKATPTAQEPTIAQIDAEIGAAINERRISSDPGNPRADAAVEAARIIRTIGTAEITPEQRSQLKAAVVEKYGLSEPVAAKVVERTRRALALPEAERAVRSEMEAQGITEADVPPVEAVDVPQVRGTTPAGRLIEAEVRAGESGGRSAAKSGATPDRRTALPIGTRDEATRSPHRSSGRAAGNPESSSADGTPFGERLNIPPVADRYFGEYAPDEARTEGFAPDPELADFGTLTRDDAVMLAREAAKERPGQYAVIPGEPPKGYPGGERPYIVVSRSGSPKPAPAKAAPAPPPPKPRQPTRISEPTRGVEAPKVAESATPPAPEPRPIRETEPPKVAESATRTPPRSVVPERPAPSPEVAGSANPPRGNRASIVKQLRDSFSPELSREQLDDVVTIFDAVVNASAKRRGLTPDEEYGRIFAGVRRGPGGFRQDGESRMLFGGDTDTVDAPEAPKPRALPDAPKGTLNADQPKRPGETEREYQLRRKSRAAELATGKMFQGRRKGEALNDVPMRTGYARASVEFTGDDARGLIRALTNPNVSSPLHELAHVAAWSVLDGKDLALSNQFVGAAAGTNPRRWSVPQHEKFARAFERYLYEGKAPTQQLREVFDRLAQWMRDIYRTLKGSAIDVKLTPEIREVFDRLLGGDGMLARIDGASGRRSELVLASGRALPIEYRIVDIKSIEPTHLPEQGFEVNPRGDKNERPYQDPTEGKQLRDRVVEISRDPKPALLVTDTPSATDGPPIINERGQVLGGNARTMAMRLTFGTDGPAADRLRLAVREAARRFDIDPAAIAGIENPVLVRVVPDEHAGAPGELSRELNESLTAARTPDADAVSRGAKLDEAAVETVLAAVGDGSLAEALSDPTRSRRILKSLVEAGAFGAKDVEALTSQGRLTDEGKSTVRRTLMGAVIRDVRTLASVPPSVENIIARALPSVVRLTRTPNGMDFERVLNDALDGMAELHRSGLSLSDLIDQATITPEPWRSNPAAIALMRALDSETPTKLAAKFKTLAEAAKDEASGQSGVFGGAITVADAFADQFGGGTLKQLSSREMDDPIYDTQAEMRDRSFGKRPKRVPETFAELKPKKGKTSPLFGPDRPARKVDPVPSMEEGAPKAATMAMLVDGITGALRRALGYTGTQARKGVDALAINLKRADNALLAYGDSMSEKASKLRESAGRAVIEAKKHKASMDAETSPVQRDRMMRLLEGAEQTAMRHRYTADALDRAAERTRRLSGKLGKFVQTHQQLKGEALKTLDGIMRKHDLSRADQRELMLAGLEGDRTKLPEKLRPAFDDLLDLMDNGPGQMHDAGRVGVMRSLPGAGFVQLRGRGAWAPQALNARGRQIAREISSGSLDTPKLDALADRMVMEGKFPTVESAKINIKAELSERLNGENRYFERARTLLPEELVDTDLYNVLRRTIDRNARTVAAGRTFGHYIDNNITGIDETVADITVHVGESAGEAFKQYMSIELGNPPRDKAFARKVASTITRSQNVMKLSGVWSAVKNLSQPFANASDYGVAPVLKTLFWDYPIFLGELDSLGKMIPQGTRVGRGARTAIEKITPARVKAASDAAVSAGVPGQLQDVVDIADFSEGAGSLFNRASDMAMIGFGAAERVNAVRTAMAAKNAAEGHLATMLAMEGPNGKLRTLIEMVTGLDFNPKASTRRRINRLGISDKDFDEALRRGSFTPEQLQGAMYRLATDTQFAMTTATKPLWYERMPAARVMFQYKNFGARMTGLVYDRGIKEAARGNLGPLARMMLGTMVASEIYRTVRGYFTGEEDRTLVEAMARPDDADRMRATAKQAYRHLQEGGLLGIMGDIERGFFEYLTGPTGGTVQSAIDAASNFNDRPTLDQAGLVGRQFLREQFSGARQWDAVAKGLKSSNRRALASREIRRRAYGWRESTDDRGVVQGVVEDALKGLKGFDRYDTAPGTLTYRFAADAINDGDIDGAAKYMANLIRDMPKGEKRKKVVTGIRSSIDRRSPLGPVSRKDREKFLRTLTPDQRKRVVELQRQFVADSATALNKALKAVAKLEASAK